MVQKIGCFCLNHSLDFLLNYNQLKFNENLSLSGTEDWLLLLKLVARFTIKLQPINTGKMIQHSERGVMSFDENQLIKRKDILINSLRDDNVFVSKYGISAIK